MKKPKLLRKFLLLVSLLPFSFTLSQQQELANVPIRPVDLLKSLPPAETGWRMTVSKAQDIPDAWPRSKAMREYVMEIVSPNGGAPSTVAAKVQITVIDTAGFPGALARFLPPKPGDTEVNKQSGERFMIGTMPALRKGTPGAKESVEALALDRFLLIATVDTTTPVANTSSSPTLKVDKPEKWIEKISIVALRDAPKKIERIDVSKNNSMVVESVDELNPQRSSRTIWSNVSEIAPAEKTR